MPAFLMAKAATNRASFAMSICSRGKRLTTSSKTSAHASVAWLTGLLVRSPSPKTAPRMPPRYLATATSLKASLTMKAAA